MRGVSRAPILNTPLQQQDSINRLLGQELLELRGGLSPRTYNLDTLDQFLYHLRPGFLDTPDVDPAESWKDDTIQSRRYHQASFCVTHGLMGVVRACHQAPHGIKEPTVRTLLANMDNIIAWWHRLILVPEEYDHDLKFDFHDPLTICNTINRVCFFDPRIKQAVYSSHAVAELAVEAWGLPDGAKGPAFILQGNGERCPIAVLLSELAYFKGPRKILLELLCEPTPQSSKRLNQYLKGFEARMKVINSLDPHKMRQESEPFAEGFRPFSRETPMQAVMNFLIITLSSTGDLAEHPIFLKSLLTSGLLKSVCEALRSWMVSKANGEQHSQHEAVILTDMLFSLFEQRPRVGRRFLSRQAMLEMIRGGLIDVVIEGFKVTSVVDQKKWETLSNVIRHTTAHSMYPDVAVAAVRELRRIRGDNYTDPGYLRSQGDGAYWRMFCTELTFATNAATHNERVVAICDNLKVRISWVFHSYECTHPLSVVPNTCRGGYIASSEYTL